MLATKDALELAQERDLDLVEVAPNSEPPVCRLLDYGKFRYLQTTKERELRKGQKTSAMREVRFRPRIGRHDIEAKERLVNKLLLQGSKVKVSVMFRGREIEHPELAIRLLRQVAEALREDAKLEQAPAMEGRMMSIVLAPAAATSGTVKQPMADSNTEDEQNAEAEDS